MADRDLSVPEIIKLYKAHGCTAFLNSNAKVIVERTEPQYLNWMQHAHKGMRDSFDRRIVAKSRRRLGFANMPDDQFYGVL